MFAQVVSKDGDVLYTRVQASPGALYETERQLRAIAQTRTSAELLADEYYLTADDAVSVRRPFGDPELATDIDGAIYPTV